MLDFWFQEDVEKLLEEKNRLVIIDEQKKAEFLFKALNDKKYKIFYANTELEEIKTKYDVEKNHQDSKVIIVTNTPIDKLTFIREYCETNSVIKIPLLHRYIVEKIDEHLGFQINLGQDEIITAGKLSFGKDKTYWKSLSVSGIAGIFENYEEEVLKFICHPKDYESSLDDKIKNIFYELLQGYLNTPIKNIPAETLAKEIVKTTFDNILYDKKNKFFSTLFTKWCNSKKDFDSLVKNLNEYEIPIGFDIWNVPANHPFKKIDQFWLKELSQNINDTEWVNSKSILFRNRAESNLAKEIGATYWEAIREFIVYDKKEVSKINSLEEAFRYYITRFYKVDRAIRQLYGVLLNDQTLLKPFQEYYEKIADSYLEKWFEYFNEYKENQTGTIKKLFSENQKPIAVIVGDGINYEVAHSVYENLSEDFNATDSFIKSDYPSDTENNMSRIYLSSGQIEAVQAKRQRILAEEFKQEITYLSIDDVSFSSLFDHLVVIAKDIDSIGEKIQLKSLKYFDLVVEQITEVTKTLLSIGYKKVFLISDHGFVLTGILNESDKIEVNLAGDKSFKSERFIATNEKIKTVPEHLIQIERQWKEYNYLLFSNNLRPYKTSGTYGYSHGGITPQELITPYMVFEKSKAPQPRLSVSINNKEELKDVIGSTFEIKLNAKRKDDDLFVIQRKVIAVFIEGQKQFYQSDIISIEADQEIKKEFTTPDKTEFELLLLDAETKEVVDKTTVLIKQVRKIQF